jgi:hypothetical protein
MSERKRHEQDDSEEHIRQDDVEEAVLAADDTGMVRNEVNIVTVETEQVPDEP